MDLTLFYVEGEDGQPQLATRPRTKARAAVERALALGTPEAKVTELAELAIATEQWRWFDAYQAWLTAGEALAARGPEQARGEDGAFVADDPTTTADEAWVDGYSPEAHQAALDAHAAAEPPRPPIPEVSDYLARCAGWDHHRKLQGVEFEGVRYSATAEDMWGLAAIKDQVRLGLATPFKFDNGNTLLLTPANIDAFEQVWVPFRAQFFA